MCGSKVKVVKRDKKLSTAQCVPRLLLLDCKQMCLSENHLRVQGYVPVSAAMSPSHIRILIYWFTSMT